MGLSLVAQALVNPTLVSVANSDVGVRAGGLSVNRRLAAVAFADLAGYSHLVAADDAGTTFRWKTLRNEVLGPLITAHHGRLIRVVGDSLFVEFHSAVDAVRWALDSQRSLEEQRLAAVPGEAGGAAALKLRIGINVEDVIVDDDDLHGDGVNIAARIQQLAEPGEIVVTQAVRDYIWNKLSVTANDLGLHHLKNINHPVRLFRIEEASEARTARSQLTSIAWSNRPTLAVLPFRNSGGNPSEDYFGEGITEDIIAGLSRNRMLFVIARNSTLRYRDNRTALSTIAAELGVRYIVEGSVRRQDARLRISSELIDASRSRTIWAQRYDGANDDLFDIQDKIASSIVATIEPKVIEAESERVRSKPTENLDAYDCLLRALPLLHGFESQQWRDAMHYIDRAIELDPRYAQAYAYCAWMHLMFIGEGKSSDIEEDAKAARKLAEQAIELDDSDAFVLAVAGHVFAFLHRQHEYAEQLFERALEINENSVFAWGMSALTYCYLGRADEAMERTRRAWRLSPFDPFNYHFLGAAGLAAFVAARYEEAVVWLRKAVRANRRFVPTQRHLVTSLAHAGREDEARAAAAELLALDPSFSINKLRSWYPLRPPENLERYLAGLKMAGLPD